MNKLETTVVQDESRQNYRKWQQVFTIRSAIEPVIYAWGKIA